MRRNSALTPCQEQECLEKQHPASASTSTPPLSATLTLIQSLKATARILRSQQSYAEARKILEKVVSLEALGSRALMESLTELGSVCFDAGDMDSSMNYHNAALNMYLDQQCEACFAALAIVNLRHVAAIYLRFGKCREALLCYTFIYKIQQTNIVDCPLREVASTVSCIGLMNYLMEEYLEALHFYQEELRLRVQLHKGNMEQEDIAIALNSIGIVYFQLDDVNAARQSFQSCLQIRQRLLGDDTVALLAHSGRSNDHCYDLAMVYFNLAAIAMKQGDDSAASRLYRRSMELKKAVFGDHPEIAVDYQYLGQLFLDHGDPQTAVEYYSEAYKVVQVLSTREQHQEGALQGGQAAVSAVQKLLVIIGNIHLLEANVEGLMENFKKAARLIEANAPGADFMENVRVFGCQLYSISRMHPPCAAEA